MREIKFRAWDKTENQMFNDVEVLKNGSIIFFEMDDNAEPIHWFNNYGENYQEEFANDMVVMQYTGLKDKNGKEIYESDIVRSIALNNDHHQKGATAILTVKYFMGNPCLCEIGYETGVAIYPFCISHELEVIGNIYENSELMKS